MNSFEREIRNLTNIDRNSFSWDVSLHIYKIWNRINSKGLYEERDREYLLRSAEYLDYLCTTYKKHEKALDKEYRFDNEEDIYIYELYNNLTGDMESRFTSEDIEYLTEYKVLDNKKVVKAPRDKNKESDYIEDLIDKVFSKEYEHKIIPDSIADEGIFNYNNDEVTIEYEVSVHIDDEIYAWVAINNFDCIDGRKQLTKAELVAKGKDIIDKLELEYEIKQDPLYDDENKHDLEMKFYRVVDNVQDGNCTYKISLNRYGDLVHLIIDETSEKQSINGDDIKLTKDDIRAMIKYSDINDIYLQIYNGSYIYKVDTVVENLRYILTIDAQTGECMDINYKSNS